MKRDNQGRIDRARKAWKRASIRVHIATQGIAAALTDAYEPDEYHQIIDIINADLPLLLRDLESARKRLLGLSPNRIRMARRFRVPSTAPVKVNKPSGNARTASKRKTKGRRAKS